MRNFIIFFTEKSGTSPLVRLLDKFEQITILHQENNTGFEPFDRHNCGRMPLRDLKKCLDMIFGCGPTDIDQLNSVYTKTAKRPLDIIDGEGAVGFKMRFTAPNSDPLRMNGRFGASKLLTRSIGQLHNRSFKKMMFDILKRHDVTVLMAVRQDVLRWGLSKYHGDGTGKPGHLQFKMARGAIGRDDIGKIRVDCSRLEKIISACEAVHAENRQLIDEFKQSGIRAHPILYEEFVADKRSYLNALFEILELEITEDEIARVLSQEEYLKKVHPDEISEFVENHEEVMKRFSDRFVSWR
jgi:hypothetical protein